MFQYTSTHTPFLKPLKQPDNSISQTTKATTLTPFLKPLKQKTKQKKLTQVNVSLTICTKACLVQL